jgi:hypothetical protein
MKPKRVRRDKIIVAQVTGYKLSVYNVFNNAVSSSDYIASNEGMIHEWEGMWKKS